MITIPLAFLRRKTATTLCVDANLSDDQRWMADPASGNGKLRHFDLCRPGGTYFPPTEIDRLAVSTPPSRRILKRAEEHRIPLLIHQGPTFCSDVSLEIANPIQLQPLAIEFPHLV